MGDSTIVKADYERHVDDIYLEVSAKLLQHVDPALPLAVAADMGRRRPRHLDSDQPSWVARWELGLETASLGRPGQWFYAGGTNVKPNIAIDSSAKTLTLPAVIFDKVKWFSDAILKPDIDLDKLIADPTHCPAIDWVWDMLPATPCRYPDPQTRRDAFTLSLVSGRYKGTQKAEDDIAHHRRIAVAYSEYLASVRGDETVIGPSGSGDGAQGAQGLGDPNLRAEARDYEDEYTWTSHDRRFIVTEKGFYGLGPQLMIVGDVIAVFPGIMVPYVLRSMGEGNRYKLVGACYVHGVMRGEVLDLEDPLGLNCGKPKEIVIV